MIRTLFDDTLCIQYGQFYIDVDNGTGEIDDYASPEVAFVGQHNGICGAAQQGKLFLVTGSSDATIHLQLCVHEAAPELDSRYGDIVEVNMTITEQPLKLCEWAWEDTHDLSIPSGHYRVRYSVQGMDKEIATLESDDEDDDTSWDTPIEGQHYRLDFWPAHDSSLQQGAASQDMSNQDAIISCTSERAAYWHSEWGNSAADKH